MKVKINKNTCDMHVHKYSPYSIELDGTNKKKNKKELICDDCENNDASSCNNVYSKNNHIYFNASFTKKSVEMMINELEKINKMYEILEKNELINVIEPKPIYLHITSYGGYLRPCFKAIDAVGRSKLEVHTIVDGYAASCGSLLASIGKKKYMGKYANILMHQLSSGACGKFSEIEDDYNNCKILMKQIIDIYEKNTSMTREEIEKQLLHDSWWDFETCLKNGVVDAAW
jgi:ATP-dependent protease ClpP protease subunit